VHPKGASKGCTLPRRGRGSHEGPTRRHLQTPLVSRRDSAPGAANALVAASTVIPALGADTGSVSLFTAGEAKRCRRSEGTAMLACPGTDISGVKSDQAAAFGFCRASSAARLDLVRSEERRVVLERSLCRAPIPPLMEMDSPIQKTNLLGGRFPYERARSRGVLESDLLPRCACERSCCWGHPGS